MEWEGVSAIAEWMGVIFIVISMVYVAREIKQNTDTVRAATELETGKMWSELHARVAHSSDMAEIWDKGHTDPEGLAPNEKRRFIWFVAEYFYLVENMFQQWQIGYLSDDSWQQQSQVVAGTLLNPLLARWWESGVSPFSAAFTDNVNAAREELGDAVWSYTPLAEI